RLQLHWLLLAGKFMRGAAVNFLRGKSRRHLQEFSGESGREPLEVAFIQLRTGIRAEGSAIGVIGVRGKAETDGAVVAFSASRIKLRKACGAPEEQDQNPSCQGIKRPQVTDLAKAEDPAGRFDHVVRSESAGFVDDKSAIIGSRTRLAGHGRNPLEGGTPHPSFCVSAHSKGDDDPASCARSPLNPMLNSAERAAVK